MHGCVGIEGAVESLLKGTFPRRATMGVALFCKRRLRNAVRRGILRETGEISMVDAEFRGRSSMAASTVKSFRNYS